MKFEDIQVITRSRDAQVLLGTKNEGAEHKLYIKDELNQCSLVAWCSMAVSILTTQQALQHARNVLTNMFWKPDLPSLWLKHPVQWLIMSKVKPRRRWMDTDFCGITPVNQSIHTTFLKIICFAYLPLYDSTAEKMDRTLGREGKTCRFKPGPLHSGRVACGYLPTCWAKVASLQRSWPILHQALNMFIYAVKLNILTFFILDSILTFH